MTETWAVLTCGHEILWDDPDEDINGSFFCNGCGMSYRVERFIDGGVRV